jgi:hypothetical protein
VQYQAVAKASSGRTALLALFVLAYAIPVLIADPLPLVDYPGHVARYYVQLHLQDSPALQRWYGFEWHLSGNLGVDLLMQILGPLLGVERAARLIVAAIPPLFVAGLFAVAKATFGRVTPTAIAAAPLAYAYPFQFGFLNFSLSVALALLAFALWIELSRNRSRLLIFGLVAPVLYVCHAYGWAVLWVLVGSWQAAEAWRARDAKRLLPALVIATPVLLLLLQSVQAQPQASDFFNVQAKLIFVLQAFRDSWFLLDLSSLGFLCALIAAGFYSNDFRRVPGLAIAAGALAILFLVMPRILLGSILADMRIVPVGLAVGLLAVDPIRARWLWPVSILFAIGRLSATVWSFTVQSASLERELGALGHIPRGAAVVALVGNGSAAGQWRLPRGGHLPSYALIRREAFANDQFIIPGANGLRLKASPVPGLDRDPEHYAFTPAAMAGKVALVSPATVDALWIIDDPRGVPPPPSGFRAAWRSGRSALFVPASPGGMSAPR